MKSMYFLSLNIIQFVPYAYGLLRSFVEQDERLKDAYQWHAPFYRLEPVETILEKISDPFLLCLSCYVWNHNHQLEIARRVKERYPKCLVVCGGPHVPESGKSYFVEHPQVDVLVHGEGEIPFQELLKELLVPLPDLTKVNGISYRSNNESVKTGPGKNLPKHLPVPSPYIKGYFEPFFENGNAGKIALWETNRGCPFACCFCDWGVRTKNRIRLRELDSVLEEIEYFGKNEVEDIYITDANFGMFSRDLQIAEKLIETRNTYGFPKRVRIQFAKRSNKTVFEISRLLHENDMLWGTTLSMQSVDSRVLEAVDRPYVSIDQYKQVKETYNRYQIPTYTELILGLPKETRDSFIEGICTLFDIGMHDDFRVFELALLPNAPLSQTEMREKYQLNTRQKPIRMAKPGCEKEYVELVFGSNTMSFEDWAYCFVFAEAVQALHNGGYTRFLSCYLNERNILSYRNFYEPLVDHMLTMDYKPFYAVKRIRKLINDFYQDPVMPQVNRILTQSDMVAFLAEFNPDRKGWQLWTYLWLWISDTLDEFYQGIEAYLKGRKINMDAPLKDLIRYQKQIMITSDYDPSIGKQVFNSYDWFGYFFEHKALEKRNQGLVYGDTHMGTSHRYELVKNDKKKFVSAAIGVSYPYSKFRHFFHQPERTRKIGTD